MKYRFKTKPFKHQLRALKKALKKGSIALFMEMGTGKSKVAIDFSAAISVIEGGRAPAARAVVACPLSVLGVWPKEIEKHDPFADNKFMGVEYRIINYDKIWRPNIYDELVEWLEGVPVKQRIFICDESHKLKRHSTRRAKAAHRLAKHCGHRVVMTGTPITNRGILDLFSQFKVVRWALFGTRFETFRDEYTYGTGFKGYKRKARKGKLRKLQRKIRPWTVVVKKDDCLDLPPRIHEEIPVFLEPRSRNIYDAMAGDAVARINGETIDAANVLARMTRLQQITGGWLHGEGDWQRVGTEKLDVYEDLLDTMWGNEREKVVVYCRYLHEMADIIKATRRVGYKVLTIRGGNRKDRERVYKTFEKTEIPTVLVCIISTGALGRNELVVARDAIFYSCNFSVDDFRQALDRIHRPGQLHKVTYYHLLVEESIDWEIVRSLRENWNFAQRVLKFPALVYNRDSTSELEEEE